MTIAPAILEQYPALNDSQRAVVGHLDGPLLVIAGPGSGKTYSIVLRAMNLLLLEKAMPREVVLCTYTEKAAFEMRDRLSAAAQKVGYRGDLSALRVTTIHGLCNRILTQHRHRTELGNSYETLDELTQLLFIFEHFEEIIGPELNDLYLGKWKSRWTAIEGARGYFARSLKSWSIPRGCAPRPIHSRKASPVPIAPTRQPSSPTTAPTSLTYRASCTGFSCSPSTAARS